MDLRRYLAIARRQAVLIALAVVVTAGLAAAYSFGTPKEYDATSVVTVGIDAAANLYLGTNSSSGSSSSKSLELDAQQATGAAVQRRVADLLQAPIEVVRKASARPGALDGQIVITASAPTAATAAKLANTYAEAFLLIRKETGPLPLQEAVTALDARLADVQRQIDSLAKDVASPTPKADTDIKKSQLAAASQLYQSLFARQQDLLFRIAVVGGDAAITQEALPPSGPARPKPIRDTALGVVLGVLLGLAAAVLRERINDKIGRRDELEVDLGQTVLAEIPIDREATTSIGNLATLDERQGPVVEAIRSLRSSVQFLGVDQPLKRIVVCSGSPGEGKSYVAANLAVAFAQAGFATTLISSDLRRPALDRLFVREAAKSRGLSSVIGLGHGSEVPLEEEAATLPIPTGISGLSFVAAGPPPPNAGELLAGRRAAEVFNVIAREAEVMIFDSPPLLALSDGAVLAAQADGVLLVARRGTTRRGALRRSIAALEGANARLLGVVLNRGEAPSSEYASYYYGGEDGSRRRRYGSETSSESGEREPAQLS